MPLRNLNLFIVFGLVSIFSGVSYSETLPPNVRKAVLTVDALLTPIFTKPDVKFVLDPKRLGYVAGMGELRFTDNAGIGAIAHEYAHAYFDANVRGLNGKTFRESLLPIVDQWQKLNEQIKELRANIG